MSYFLKKKIFHRFFDLPEVCFWILILDAPGNRNLMKVKKKLGFFFFSKK
jgi:hypothetical protein